MRVADSMPWQYKHGTSQLFHLQSIDITLAITCWLEGRRLCELHNASDLDDLEGFM